MEKMKKHIVLDLFDRYIDFKISFWISTFLNYFAYIFSESGSGEKSECQCKGCSEWCCKCNFFGARSCDSGATGDGWWTIALITDHTLSLRILQTQDGPRWYIVTIIELATILSVQTLETNLANVLNVGGFNGNK